MKTAMFLCLSLLLLGTLPATSAKRYSDNLYKDVIARNCKVVEREKVERYYNIPWNIPRNTIQIRSVRALSRGWLRISAFASSNGRQAHGYVDYNPRRRQVSCPIGNWIFGPKLPLWPAVQNVFGVNR